MFARFFVDRPIFASVLSILIALVGSLSVFRLPLSQYPPVTPPTIQVDCNYPGASAQVVAETIAAPIEQQVNGVEEMLYMNSQCTSDGSYTLTVTFKIGTNLNMAQVLVQNRVSLALPNLPDVVRATGVITRKRSPEILQTISLHSPTGKYDQLYLSNYAVTRVREELSRLPGIADVLVFGQRDYSMRLWIDPDKLAAKNLTALDVVTAVKYQNAQVAVGQIGQPPTGPEQQLQITLDTLGRLTEIKDYENIVLKATHAGQVVRVKDVARVELNAKSQDVSNSFDKKPTIGMAIFLLPDANALETADMLKERMDDLSKDFPDGLQYEIGYDTTPFIRESIRAVVYSLRDAVILVAIVVLVFLQSWRSALIPLAAVPVAIIGTFGAMAAVGFSLNHLTLFGLVLAVGIVVDDAIVVVEAVQHQIELGYAPREATLRAMHDVAGPIVAVGMVLSAVFLPCAFLSGIVGQFFRQFALTIAISSLISTFNSLTLSPALAALLLKPAHAKPDLPSRGLNFLLGWFFNLFNRFFSVSGKGYVWVVGMSLRAPIVVLLIYAGMIAGAGKLYLDLPGGFIPQQDKGYLIASIQLPDAASAGRTREIMAKLAGIAMDTKGVKHTNAVAGNSFVLSAYGSNFGSMFIILDDFADRQSPELYSDKIAATLRKRIMAEIPGASVNVFGAPPVSGLGRAGGFRLMIEDRNEVGPAVLQGMTDNLIEKANKNPNLLGLFTVYKMNSPQIFLDVDRTACMTHGVDIMDVFSLLQATMGSRYVNDFNYLGRTWQVNVQSEKGQRNTKEDIGKLKIRNNRNEMVPLGALTKAKDTFGPLVITRYNTYPAATVNGNFAEGVSSGDASAVLEQLCEQELPNRMGYEWSELVFIEKLSKDTGMVIFGLSVAVVFLVLAFLYESWLLPLAVILVVPMCVVSSVAGVAIAELDINIFTQVGFVVLIGLACKNAILIVEFAKTQREEGKSRQEAILAACRLRFRPILMTSFAFILGVLPLLYSQGAGSEMRKALGTAVFSGMLGVTLFGIFLTPVFFYLMDGFRGERQSVGWWRPMFRFLKREVIEQPVTRRVLLWLRLRIAGVFRRLGRFRLGK